MVIGIIVAEMYSQVNVYERSTNGTSIGKYQYFVTAEMMILRTKETVNYAK
jgi:hypothetical protein